MKPANLILSRILAACVSLCLLASCSPYRTFSIAPPPAQLSSLALFFPGNDGPTRSLGECLAFAFREAGFDVMEIRPGTLAPGSETPGDRLLHEKDLALLAGRIPGRLLIQGRYGEIRHAGLLEDTYHQVLVVQVVDLRLKRPVGQVHIYSEDRPAILPTDRMELSRQLRRSLSNIQPEVRR